MLRTVSFFSNFLNHHQLPLCEEMYNRLGDGFKFIAAEPIHPERLAMGYKDMDNGYPFVIKAYENHQNYLLAMQKCIESDFVIIGAASDIFIQSRLRERKIIFRYMERIFRNGLWRILDPRIMASLYKNHFRYRKQNLFMLCASAYTAGDFDLAQCYKNKTFKWGYFPKVESYDIDEVLGLKRKNKKLIILWVGRLLKLKHPENAIYVAEQLKSENVDFEMQIIGEGEQKEFLRTMIISKNLQDEVKTFGFMAPENVRDYMTRADIFLFTSDYQEGWGAVLNEAMNSGCAVVASHSIGSVPFLISHGINGLVYKNGDFSDLYEKVKNLIYDAPLRYRMGKNAFLTMTQTWNAENACNNLFDIYSSIISHTPYQISEGPCSPAKPIKQSEMYTYCTRQS